MAIADRLEHETSPEQAATFWNATRILMGLRYSEEQVELDHRGGIRHAVWNSRNRGVIGLSRDPQRKGEAQEGRHRGPAEGGVEDSGRYYFATDARSWGRLMRENRHRPEYAEIHDLDRLELLLERILDVSSWDELLAPTNDSA